MGCPVSDPGKALVARWLRLLGPWPMRPVVVFIFASYFYMATSTGQQLAMGNVETGQWAAKALGQAVLSAAGMAGVVYLGRLWQERHGARVSSYVAVVFLAAGAGIVLRISSGAIPAQSMDTPVEILAGFLRLLLLVELTLGITGLLTGRIQGQVDATQSALAELEVQQRLMLQADEAARQQVAALLHDRVQAWLIAIALELQMLVNSTPECDKESARAIIARLEELRTLDVRRAARALSPDLHDVDLQSALEDLAAQYEPGMGTTVLVDPAIDEQRVMLGDEVVLGIYRIIEQALMNSASHGAARHANVTVSMKAHAVVLFVSDDGRGLAPHRRPGNGAAVLTAWTRLFDGQWKLDDSQPAGAVLRVTLQIPPHD